MDPPSWTSTTDRTCVHLIREYRTRSSMDPCMNDLYQAYHHDMHNRRVSYVFEDIYPAFDIAYGLPTTEKRTTFDESSSKEHSMNPWVTRSPAREALRNYAASLTRLGIMTFRFRGTTRRSPVYDSHGLLCPGLLLGRRKSPAHSKYRRCCSHHTLER